MRDDQFKELLSKLEEIRCGIIDVETVTEGRLEAKDYIEEKIFSGDFFIHERTGKRYSFFSDSLLHGVMTKC